MRRGAQVLLQGGERFEGDEPNPFRGEGNEQLASVAYRRALAALGFTSPVSACNLRQFSTRAHGIYVEQSRLLQNGCVWGRCYRPRSACYGEGF